VIIQKSESGSKKKLVYFKGRPSRIRLF